MYMLTFMFNDKESVQFPCTNCLSAFYTLPFLRWDIIISTIDKYIIWAENFIEINAWYLLFINLKINLIFSL